MHRCAGAPGKTRGRRHRRLLEYGLRWLRTQNRQAAQQLEAEEWLSIEFFLFVRDQIIWGDGVPMGLSLSELESGARLFGLEGSEVHERIGDVRLLFERMIHTPAVKRRADAERRAKRGKRGAR